MTVAAVSRSLDIMECLVGVDGGRELGEIADRVDTPRSAVHRILATLMARGWVVQDEATQHYALSLKLSTLAFRDLDVRLVTDVVQAILDQLARQTREYCRLAIVEGEGVAWVSRAQGAVNGLRYDADMGQEVALHATATGKAWLATLPEEDAVRIVCARGFFRHLRVGPRALTTIDELRHDLAKTRARGYAVAVEEAEPGIVALAATFRADARPGSPVAGTLSVAGPVSRVTPDRHAEIRAALAAAVASVEAVWQVRVRQRGHGNGYGVKTAASAGGGDAAEMRP